MIPILLFDGIGIFLSFAHYRNPDNARMLVAIVVNSGEAAERG